MMAEVTQTRPVGKLIAHEFRSRRGHHDLTPVRRGGDSRRAVHVHPDVATIKHLGRPGMDADPDAYLLAAGPRVRRKRALCGDSRTHRGPGSREVHEEAVALGAQL